MSSRMLSCPNLSSSGRASNRNRGSAGTMDCARKTDNLVNVVTADRLNTSEIVFLLCGFTLGGSKCATKTLLATESVPIGSMKSLTVGELPHSHLLAAVVCAVDERTTCSSCLIDPSPRGNAFSSTCVDFYFSDLNLFT